MTYPTRPKPSRRAYTPGLKTLGFTPSTIKEFFRQPIASDQGAGVARIAKINILMSSKIVRSRANLLTIT
jgi:hypothetical protein